MIPAMRRFTFARKSSGLGFQKSSREYARASSGTTDRLRADLRRERSDAV